MDHHQSNNNRHSNGGSRGNSRKNKAAASQEQQQQQQQQQRNNLLMEAAALSANANSRNQQQQQQQLAELFAAHQHHQQQQQLAHHLAALTSSASSGSQQASSSTTSASAAGNPLSLLQQQMNAIMQQTAPPTSTSSSASNSNNSPFNNPAAAWWYLEYLSRIQAAQIIPNLELGQQQPQQSSSSSTKSKKSHQQLQQQLQRELPPPVVPAPTTTVPSSNVQAHTKRPGKRKQLDPHSSTTTAANMPHTLMSLNSVSDPLNLSSKSSLRNNSHHVKIPKLQSPSPSPPVQLASSTSSSATLQPPAAHSTPINLSTPPGKYSSATKEPLPAHINNKAVGYTHMIPKSPQMGLIGSKKPPPTISTEKQSKKKTVASLLAQTRGDCTPPLLTALNNSEISYRPWLVNEGQERLIIPNIVKKESADYNLPLKMNWKRETVVKSLDDLMESCLDGTTVTYTTPSGLKCKSLTEIKKQLNQRTAELTPKHFNFNSNLFIGTFVLNFDGEILRLPGVELKPLLKDAGTLIGKLSVMKLEEERVREEVRLKLAEEEREKEDKERKKQHLLLIKSLEIHKKNRRRIKLQNERKLKKKLVEEVPEKPKVKEDLDELFDDVKELKEISNLETCLSPTAFSKLLQVYEFLNTFGETLGFDMESLPTLDSLLKGFINHPENEEELQSILIHLIVCAVEDPGMPNPTKHLTPFNQTLKQADVTFGSLSEILRIYLEGISDSEPEAETYTNWLGEAPFTAHNPGRKTAIVAFLCDILLQNKAVLKHLEQSSELIHNCKKERQQNDIKIRKLRMLSARKAVALACEDDTEKIGDTDIIEISQPSTPLIPPTPATPTEIVESESEEPSDADSKLTIEEVRSKMSTLQNVNEKLKKQMHMNIKNIRSSCLGQDRFRRRYWNLPHSGGIFVEGGRSSEFTELNQLVKARFENGQPEDKRIKDCKSAAKIIVENVTPLIEQQENIPPPPINLSNNGVFEVPPPVIKIFSFQKDNLCSGKPPLLNLIKKEIHVVGPTDDEILIANITPDKWNHYYIVKDDVEVSELITTLAEKGVRERGLLNSLSNTSITKPVPEFEDNEVNDEIMDQDVGVDPDLIYKIHLGLIETLETLEERVASASLQIKGWTLPLPRNLQHTSPKQSEIIEIVKTRLLDLEQAVERRYLKPPLGKSANELNLSNLVGEDNANALNTNEINNGPPCGSTSSTRGQQIQENNKLKELKEKEERMLAANESKNSCSRFLTHWRDAILKSGSPSVLSMAIYLLDSSIAWDKSVMKASCQLCKGGDNEDKLLLCDACDRGYHTYCFKPPLEQIPEGDWFCWECINKATGNRGCIVCGKGNLQGKKLLACDKCVKAYHTDCISPPVNKVPRGRWYCPDHQITASASSRGHHHHHHQQTTSPSKKKVPTIPIVLAATPTKIEPVTPIPTPPVVAPLITSDNTPIILPVVEPLSTTLSSASSSPVKKNGGNTTPTTSTSPALSGKKLKRELAWCEKIVEELASHDEAWPFLEPVNTRQFPTYKKVIKTPMDLATIRKSLLSGVYKSREQFLTDVRLIFDNCETFNEDDSPVGKAGHSLRVYFESKTFTGGSCDSSTSNLSNTGI